MIKIEKIPPVNFLGKNRKNLKISAVLSINNVFGTYIHGIFDNDDFRRQILNAIRLTKKLEPIKNTRNVRAEKQRNYERLAKIVRENINMDLLNSIIFAD